ncbi:MAG: AsmA family protein [candidate division NC10 bacterium]|nr:AsmA family protein [candidate division NC10 bacterium]
MRKLTIAAIILIVLAAVVAFALLNLDRLVKRNKDYILAQVEQALGRKVTVEDIGVTLWGGIGVRLKNLTLADDRAFSTQDFLRAADLQVNVEFLPLLRKELRVKRLILRKPVVTAIRDKGGAFNFATIGGPGRAEPQKKTEGVPPSSTTGTKVLPFLVSLVDVAAGELHYIDHKAGVELRATQVDLNIKDLGFDRPVSMTLAAAINSDRRNLAVQGKIGPLPPGVSLDDPKGLRLSGDVNLGPVTFADLRRLPVLAESLPAELKGDGALSLTAHVDGTLEDMALSGKGEGTAATISFGERFRKPQGVPLLLSWDARVTQNEIALKKAKIELHTLELTGNGAVTRGSSPAVRLALDSNRSDIAGWEKIFPALRGQKLAGSFEVHTRIQGRMAKDRLPDINGSLTLTELRATLPQVPQPLTTKSATVNFTGQGAALGETPFSIGKSQMRLAAQAERLAPISLTYRLAAPELWLADLREGRGAGKTPEVLRQVTGEGRAWMEKGIFSSQGKISSARGTINDINYTDLQAAFSMAGQVVTIDSFALKALKGSLQGRGQYDMRESTPRFTATTQVRDVDLAELLHWAAPAAPRHLRGGINLDMNLAGSGNRWEEIQRSLSGKGQAEIMRGALLDVNLAESTLAGLTRVPGLSMLISPRVRNKYPVLFSSRNTEFGQLKGSLGVREGKFLLDNFLITATDWAAKGQGWMGLDQSLDMRTVVFLSRELSTDLIADVKGLKYLTNKEGRLEIPVALTGTLPRVTPQPDLNYVSRQLQRRLIGEGIEEITKGLQKPKSPPAEQPLQPGTGAPPPAKPPEKRPEEELLKGLKDLFRK